jgi:hypothetical protein
MFHITIGSYPSQEISLETDLRLVKAALLYADKVKLCSLTSSMMLTLVTLKESDLQQHLEMLEVLIPPMSADQDQAKVLVEQLRHAKQILYKEKPTKRELLQRAQIRPKLSQMRSNLKEIAEKMLRDAGMDSLTGAIQSGLLELHTFHAGDTWDSKSMTNEFVNVLSTAISTGSTYPLFDDQTGNLVNLGVQAGQITVSEAGVTRGKHCGLASRLLERLPLFDEASVSEILDIRRELEVALVRFRSVMIKFSEQIKTAAWDADFSFEAEQVFQRDVEPAILDIEEAVRSNKYLASLTRKLLDKPLIIPGGSVLGLAMSQLGAMPQVIAQALGVGIASGAVAYDAYEEWKQKKQTTEQNQLFFYYRSGKLLEGRVYEYQK